MSERQVKDSVEIKRETTSPGVEDHGWMNDASVPSDYPYTTNPNTVSSKALKPSNSNDTAKSLTAKFRQLFKSRKDESSSMDDEYSPEELKCATSRNEDVEWQIRYYEFSKRVGSQFDSNNSVVSVDGMCVTGQPNRMSIGSMTNGSRQPGVVNVRAQIRKGIVLKNENGLYKIYNMGESSVFVQTPCISNQRGDQPGSVYRLGGCTDPAAEPESLVIFDKDHFNEIANNTKNATLRSIPEFQSLCSARVSFVKGYGAKYHRQNVIDCPVWIEIFFCKYLNLVDRMVFEFKSDKVATSYT